MMTSTRSTDRPNRRNDEDGNDHRERPRDRTRHDPPRGAQVPQGGREGAGDRDPGQYQIERKQVASLKKRFAKWDEARKAPEADEAPEPTDAD
jgi:hypothetical protein